MIQRLSSIQEEENGSCSPSDALQPPPSSDLWRMNESYLENDLFRGIPREEAQALDLPIEEVRYERDEIVFEEGSRGEHLYLIADGLIQISKKGRGGQQEIFGQKSPGEFFGEMGVLLEDGIRSARATAQEPSTLGRIDRAGLIQFLEHSPQSALHLIRVISEQLRSANSFFIAELLDTERLSLVGSMMASIVHDIRNPIAAISMAGDYLMGQTDQPDLLELGQLTKQAVDQMQVMIQELLDFSRGQSRVNLEGTTVQNLFDQLDVQILHQFTDQGIEVNRNLEYTGEITVDSNRILRLFGNILKNAQEAMPQGGILSIKTRSQDGEIEFEVKDTGCGIPAEVLSRIFEPFVTHGKSDGTGLGMAIARSVVEAHQGKIEIDSLENVGTVCRIRLPQNLPIE